MQTTSTPSFDLNFQNLTWDGAGDGNWADVQDDTSRWLAFADEEVPVYPHSDFTHASITSNTVTVPASTTATAADVTVSNGPTLVLGSSSTVDANVTINGTLDPVHGLAGTATIDGNLTLGSSAVYLCQTGASGATGDPTGDPDKIVVTGTTSLAGELRLLFSGLTRFKSGTHVLVDSTGNLTGTFGTVTPIPGELGSYVGANHGISYDYAAEDAKITFLHALHPGDADMDAKTDISDLNIWNQYKFTTGTDWLKADFNADTKTDVSDLNIWMAYRYTSADGRGEGGGGDAPVEGLDNMIDLVYDPVTGIMSVDTKGTRLMSLMVAGPQAVSVDRWNKGYQDNLSWAQAYFDGKQQWGGLGESYVPEDVYQIATYKAGLKAEDFGKVEFGTYEGNILYATVTIGKGPSGSLSRQPTAGALTDAALESLYGREAI